MSSNLNPTNTPTLAEQLSPGNAPLDPNVFGASPADEEKKKRAEQSAREDAARERMRLAQLDRARKKEEEKEALRLQRKKEREDDQAQKRQKRVAEKLGIGVIPSSNDEMSGGIVAATPASGGSARLVELIKKNEGERKKDWEEGTKIWGEQLTVNKELLKHFTESDKIDKDAVDENNENARRVVQKSGKGKSASAMVAGMAEPRDSQDGPDLTPSTDDSPDDPKDPSVAGAVAAAGVLGASKAASAIGKALSKGKNAAGKVMAKGVGKSVLKKIPVIGALAGLGFGAQRAFAGDFSGAGLEVASGLASTIPGAGTAASLGIDGALMARDMKREGTVEAIKRPQIDHKISAPTGPMSGIAPTTTIINNNTTQAPPQRERTPMPIEVRPSENSFMRYQDKRMPRLM